MTPEAALRILAATQSNARIKAGRLLAAVEHFLVWQVSRVDRDAGWCYDLDLMWMAYGFAKPT